MRKSINEKLRIVKESTSSSKIKKLSIQHGITTKTIRNWIRQAEEGKLVYDPGTDNSIVSKKNTFYRSGKPLNNFVYKISGIGNPVKRNGCLYRHLFKDTVTGLVFCGYSNVKDEKSISSFCENFLCELKKYGYTPKSIMTDKIPEFRGLGDTIEAYKGEFTQRKLSEIKPMTVFSLKRNSFMKERTKYENYSDFLFDSMATSGKNNDIICSKRKINNEVINAVKRINYQMHSGINTKELNVNLEKEFEKGVEFHKKYDMVNADYIYEKIYHILKGSSTQTDLFIKVLIQRAKILGLKKDSSGLRNYCKEGLRLVKYQSVEERLKNQVLFYYILADHNKIEGHKKRALFYMGKIECALSNLNDPVKTASFYINLGRTHVNFSAFDKGIRNYDISRAIIDKHNLDQLRVFLEESYADTYSRKGDYENTKKVYKKMIDEEFYSDSPYFRGLLFAKYADQFHLTGDLSECVKNYEKAVGIINKHNAIKVFQHLEIIVRSNMALSLFKMNKISKSKEIFTENLRIAQEGNFGDQVFTNTAFLLMAECGAYNMQEAEKRLNELGLLLKNIHKPEIEYKYHYGSGEIYREKKEYKKAEEHFIKAVSICSSIANIRSAYYDSHIKLLDFYAVTGNTRQGRPLAEQIIKKASKNMFEVYLAKAEVIQDKINYFANGNIKGYIDYLQKAKGSNCNEEVECFIQSEISRHFHD